MAVRPYHRSPEEDAELLRGEMQRRNAWSSGLPGQGMPRAFAAPVGPSVALASRPGPGTLSPEPEQEAATVPLDPAPMRAQQAAGPAAAPPAERSKGWQYADAILSGLAGNGSYNQGRYDAMDAESAKERKAAAMRDPASAESAAMRQRVGPLLQQLGLRPDELAALSGEDMAAVSSKGDLLAGVMEARQKAAAGEAKAQADAAKTKADQAEFDRRAALTGDTAEAKLERARAAAGTQEDRAVRMAQLQNAMQRASELDRRAYQLELDKLRREQALEDENRRRAAAEAARNDEAIKQGKVPIEQYELPGWKAANPQRAQQTVYDTERRKKLEDTADANSKIQTALENMRKIHARVGTTVFDERSASEYELERANVTGGLAALKGTGALNEADERRFGAMVPSIQPGLTWLDAKEAIGVGSKGDALAGAASALRRQAETYMKQFGFAPAGGGSAKGKTKPAAQAPRQAVGQDVSDADSPEWEDY